MDNSAIFMAVAGVLVIVLFALSFVGGKTKKLRVVSSQPDPQTGGVVIEILYRGNKEKWNDSKGMRCFRNEDGIKVWLGEHWIMRMDEVK